MKMVRMEDLEAEQAFAKEAAAHFATHPKHWTYSSGPLKPGCLMALRWGAGDDCVVVVKLDDYHVPTNYQEVIKS